VEKEAFISKDADEGGNEKETGAEEEENKRESDDPIGT
jgi:hypothetical protein